MERLTYSRGISKGVIGFDEDFCYTICDEFSSNCDNCPVQKVILKLIDYEDTKFTPEQIHKLDETKKSLQKENRELKAKVLKMMNYSWYKNQVEEKEEEINE